MNTQRTLQVYAGYSLLMGLAFIFMAGNIIESMGAVPNDLFIATQQIWGVYIIGIGAISWFMSDTDNADFFKAMTILTGLIVVVTLYHISAKGLGAPPLYVNVVVNAAVGGISFTKMH